MPNEPANVYHVLMRPIDAAALSALVVLGVSAVSVSVLMLRKGRFYKSLNPSSRPRRWVLLSLLFLLAVFVLWFPIWTLWPHTVLARVLTVLFGLTFFVVTMTLKWFSSLVDWFIERRGWPLR